MLSITISLSPRDSAPESASPAYVHEIERNNVRVRASARPLYSFYAEFGQTIVIGESLVPMTSARLVRLEKMIAGQFSCESSGDDYLLALIVIDTIMKEVTISAATMPMRPLFYHVAPEKLSIATTLSDMRNSGVSLVMDESRLPEFYVYRFVSPPNTLVKGVNRMIGGQTITFSLVSGKRLREHCTDSLASNFDSGKSVAECLERVESSLRTVIHDTLTAYKRPMVLMSGGNDSALLALMALKADPRVRSCSTSFSFLDKEDMEESYAQSFADRIGIKHTIYRPTAEEYLAGVVESIAATDEPLHHLQTVLLYLLSKNYGSREADLVINGLFSDGLFGDDVHYAIWKHRRAIAFLRATGLTAPLRKLYRLSGISSMRLHFLTNDFRQIPTSPRHIVWGIGQYGDLRTVKRLFGGSDEIIFGSRMEVLSRYEKYSVLDKNTVVNGLVLSSYTGSLWGRMAEVSGNVASFPFSAQSVIDSVTDTPWPLRLKETKHFVKELLRKYGIEDSYISRPKKSFGFPFKYWSLPNTLFQPFVDMAAGSYDRSLLASLQTGSPGSAMILWNVLNLHLWRQIVIDQKNPKDLASEAISRYRTLPHSR